MKYSLRGLLGGLIVIAVVTGGPRRASAGFHGSERHEAQLALGEAISLEASGRRDEADAQYRRALAFDPQSADIYARYSLSLYALREFAKGVALLDRAVRAIPGRKELHAYRAMHLHRLGRAREAFDAFGRAEALTTLRERFEIQAALAQCAVRVGDGNAALAAIANYLEHRPTHLADKDFVLKTLAAKVLLGRDPLTEAAPWLRQVLVRHRGYLPAQELRAEYLLRTGDCDRANKTYLELERRRPSVLIQLRLAEAARCRGKFAEALSRSTRYLDANAAQLGKLLGHPKENGLPAGTVAGLRTALLVRGDAALALGRPDAAQRDFQSAWVFSRGNPQVARRLQQARDALRRTPTPPRGETPASGPCSCPSAPTLDEPGTGRPRDTDPPGPR